MRRNRLGKAIRAGLLALTIVGATVFANADVVNASPAVQTVDVTEAGATVDLTVTVGESTIQLNLTNGRRQPIEFASYEFGNSGFNSISPITSVARNTTGSFNMTGSASTSAVIRLSIMDCAAGSRLSYLTINLTVVDGSGNVVGTRPWVNTGGGTGTGANNNSSSTGVVPSHVHSSESNTTKEPTVDPDGEEIFERESADKIKEAPMFGTVNIETSSWNSFGSGIRDALTARPDVTLKVSFLSGGYKGKRLKLTIPAGYDIASLYDKNGFCGLCHAGTILGYDQ